MTSSAFSIIFLLGIDLISAPLAWTANPDLALTAVILVDVWKTTPFMTLLILAALQILAERFLKGGAHGPQSDQDEED